VGEEGQKEGEGREKEGEGREGEDIIDWREESAEGDAE